MGSRLPTVGLGWWRHRYRVNYEAAAYLLADRLVAVLAPCSGERPSLHLPADQMLPVRPRHRSPDDPEGRTPCSHRGPSGGSPTAAKPAAPCS